MNLSGPRGPWEIELKKVVKEILDLSLLAQLKLDLINLSDNEVKATYSRTTLV